MNKQFIAVMLIFFGMFLQTTHTAIAQDAPTIPKEFDYDNTTYYYVSNWKDYERTLYADLDYDGQTEAVISFVAGTKPDGWKEGDVIFYMPFCQIYKKTGFALHNLLIL